MATNKARKKAAKSAERNAAKKLKRMRKRRGDAFTDAAFSSALYADVALHALASGRNIVLETLLR